MNQEYVYVMLSDTGTLFTRLIKAYTRAPYNHASLALENSLDEVFSFGRKEPSNPLRGGLVKEDVYSGVYRVHPATRCIIMKVEITREQKEQLGEILYRYYGNRGQYTYNLLGLLGVMMRFNYSPRNAFFCSQFVAEVLREAGVSLWDKPSAQITPHHFCLHPDLEVVYEGRLYDYPHLDSVRMRENAPGEMAPVMGPLAAESRMSPLEAQ